MVVAKEDLVESLRDGNDLIVGELFEGEDRTRRGKFGDGGRGTTGVVGTAPKNPD